MKNADTPETLWDKGWRQGSIAELQLSVTGYDLDDNGELVHVPLDHGLWIVANQDCDLSSLRADDREPLVELRPVKSVEEGGAPLPFGIRSRKLNLGAPYFVEAEGRRATISARLLAGKAVQRPAIPDERARSFKKWLGLRYDRPAVPPHREAVVKAIKESAKNKALRPTDELVHDLLIQFKEDSDPPQYALFAVIVDDADREEVRRWVGEIALAVPETAGVLVHYDAGTKAETPLELVETAYAADATDLTWRTAVPRGAE